MRFESSLNLRAAVVCMTLLAAIIVIWLLPLVKTAHVPIRDVEINQQHEPMPRPCSSDRLSIPQWRLCYGPYPRYSLTGGNNDRNVYCWPSSGGIWAMSAFHLHAVHARVLGLDLGEDTWKSDNATEEDIFCDRMKRIVSSATFFPDANTFLEHNGVSGTRDFEPVRRAVGIWELPSFHICWPDWGGVFVLAPPNGDDRAYWTRYINALSVEEMCDLIEGARAAKFCANYVACPQLGGRTEQAPEVAWW